MSTEEQAALVVAEHARVVETVLASAAAVGRSVEVMTLPEEVRDRWRRAPVVLVGAECAAMVVGLGLPVRTGVHLLATSSDEAVRWSAPLQAPVVVLPDGAGRVTGLLADVGATAGAGQVVALCGASGGLGTSSLVAGMAQVAARAGRRVAAVEASRHSGGLDLLLGAEQQPGWRWPDLSSAAGHLGDLSGRLPRAAEIDLVSVGRRSAAVPESATVAVVQALSRSHELVLLDLGPLGENDLPAGLVSQTLLLVGADVRAVVAARSRLAARRGTDPIEALVRVGRDRRLAPAEVGRAVGLPVRGVVRDDRGVPQALEAGDQPARRPRSVFARDCRALVAALGEQVAA